MDYKPESKRQMLEILRSQLDNERSTFLAHWRDLSEFILPRRSRFFVSDVNKGDRRNQKIVDSTATLACRTLRSGMMSGITSPARPWFRLTTPDPNLAEVGAVKDWLYVVGQRMSTIFLKSNLYNVLPSLYGDIGTFGTAAIAIEEDFDEVVRFQSFPIGSYMIAKDYRGRVNVFYREFRMTIRQLVEQFGNAEKEGEPDWNVFSDYVRTAWCSGQRETWVDVCHAVYPNDEYDENKKLSKHKKFASVYYERGISGSQSGYLRSQDDDKFLRESGYDYFPVLCPRWETTGEDVYGTDCPGMTALGDIKALQLMQKRKAQAVEKMINPPMSAPTSMRNAKASLLPGDINFVDVREGQQGFKPVQELNFRVAELAQDIIEHQNRIRRAFYEDLFLMLANTDRRQITAREIDERHEEKLLALGPVLEQLNQDLLDPLIDITFDIMVRQELIPEPPAELQGVELRIEYISIMAQAQKLIGIAGVERFAGFVGQVATFAPDVLDKLDVDQTIDVYGDMTSMPPGIIRPDDKVAGLRNQRQKAMAAQQAAMIAQQTAGAAKDMSQTDMSGDNALTRLVDQAQSGSLVPME